MATGGVRRHQFLDDNGRERCGGDLCGVGTTALAFDPSGEAFGFRAADHALIAGETTTA